MGGERERERESGGNTTQKKFHLMHCTSQPISMLHHDIKILKNLFSSDHCPYLPVLVCKLLHTTLRSSMGALGGATEERFRRLSM